MPAGKTYTIRASGFLIPCKIMSYFHQEQIRLVCNCKAKRKCYPKPNWERHVFVTFFFWGIVCIVEKSQKLVTEFLFKQGYIPVGCLPPPVDRWGYISLACIQVCTPPPDECQMDAAQMDAPTPCEQNDTCLWKHYLPHTSYTDE